MALAALMGPSAATVMSSWKNSRSFTSLKPTSVGTGCRSVAW